MRKYQSYLVQLLSDQHEAIELALKTIEDLLDQGDVDYSEELKRINILAGKHE